MFDVWRIEGNLKHYVGDGHDLEYLHEIGPFGPGF
jgi:hypothetical protein